MEGSGGRIRQRARSLRIPSRIKTLRSSGDAEESQASAANQSESSGSRQEARWTKRGHNGERGRPRATTTSVVKLKGGGSCRENGEGPERSPRRKQGRALGNPASKKRCLQPSSIYKTKTGYGCGGGKTFEG